MCNVKLKDIHFEYFSVGTLEVYTYEGNYKKSNLETLFFPRNCVHAVVVFKLNLNHKFIYVKNCLN